MTTGQGMDKFWKKSPRRIIVIVTNQGVTIAHPFKHGTNPNSINGIPELLAPGEIKRQCIILHNLPSS